MTGPILETSSDRSFGLVFTLFFTVIGLVPLYEGKPPPWGILAVAGLFLATSLFRPSLLAPLNRLWTRFGLLLHRIVSPLVLGAIFFGVLTPTALLMRLTGKRPLDLRWEGRARSYWRRREPPGPAPESMSQQF
ncbi:MAG: hypothetical protein HQL57_06905 [Magnetococcales bacterium]|nr:hypothetical protein [Magnetococcales bacterium]MBF0156898.1 hypothetical protein [Magnetococcales bacterium]